MAQSPQMVTQLDFVRGSYVQQSLSQHTGWREGWRKKALPGADWIRLPTFCAQFAVTVDFSTCRSDWPVFTGLLPTQGLRVEVDARLLLRVDPACVLHEPLVCFVSVSTMAACLKRTTCRKCNCFWSWFLVPNISDNSEQSFSVTRTCN